MNPFETGEYCGLPSAHLRDRGISRCRSNSEVGDACLVRAFRFTQRLTGLNVKDMIHKYLIVAITNVVFMFFVEGQFGIIIVSGVVMAFGTGIP